MRDSFYNPSQPYSSKSQIRIWLGPEHLLQGEGQNGCDEEISNPEKTFYLYYPMPDRDGNNLVWLEKIRSNLNTKGLENHQRKPHHHGPKLCDEVHDQECVMPLNLIGAIIIPNVTKRGIIDKVRTMNPAKSVKADMATLLPVSSRASYIHCSWLAWGFSALASRTLCTIWIA